MFRPIQPQFEIQILNGKNKSVDTLRGANVTSAINGDYINITPCVAYPVVYEEQQSLINTLSFKINRFADILLYYFYIGQTIVFRGGFYSDKRNQMRHVFTGTVTRIKTHFADNGTISFTVECMNYGFTKLGKDSKNFVYPDAGSSRKFAQAENLNLEQIVRGIAEANNFEVGEIDLSSAARKVDFNKINIRYQKNTSDWKFLTQLAKSFGCTVWISTEDGVEKINFCSYEKAVQKQSEIMFIYPLYGVTNKLLGWDGTINEETDVQKFSDPAYNRPRILRDVNVDEDISQATAVTRSKMYYDKETGEYKESVSRIESKDGKNYIVFYELDEERVKWVHEHIPKLADTIRENGPTSMKWGDPKVKDPYTASYYYRCVEIYDEDTSVFDVGFFGVTVTAKCNQDLDIHSQRSYIIKGILSYRTENSLESRFLLRGLKHIWDADGTWTELDFMR